MACGQSPLGRSRRGPKDKLNDGLAPLRVAASRPESLQVRVKDAGLSRASNLITESTARVLLEVGVCSLGTAGNSIRQLGCAGRNILERGRDQNKWGIANVCLHHYPLETVRKFKDRLVARRSRLCDHEEVSRP